MEAGLLAFVGRRLAGAVPLMAVIVVLTFLLIHAAPGDPATLLAGDAASPKLIEQVRNEYHLNQPLVDQLGIYLLNMIHGNMGISIYYDLPVNQVILQRAPNTLLLIGVSLILAVCLGAIAAVLSVANRDTIVDSLISGISISGYAIPSFWLAQMLVIVFAVGLHWFPTGGMTTIGQSLPGFAHIEDVLGHLILPAVTLAVFEMGLVARFMRAGLLDALDKEFVTVAYAKGLDKWAVIIRHAIPNSVLPVASVVGQQFGVLVAGAVVIETVFSWPGIGQLFYGAIFNRDYPLLMGCFIYATVGVVLANLATDAIYAAIDPRVYRS